MIIKRFCTIPTFCHNSTGDVKLFMSKPYL